MAYDEELAERVRGLVQDTDGLSENRLFGGLAFLVNGNMAVSASGQGGLLLRVDPAETAELVDQPSFECGVIQARHGCTFRRAVRG